MINNQTTASINKFKIFNREGVVSTMTSLGAVDVTQKTKADSVIRRFKVCNSSLKPVWSMD